MWPPASGRFSPLMPIISENAQNNIQTQYNNSFMRSLAINVLDEGNRRDLQFERSERRLARVPIILRRRRNQPYTTSTISQRQHRSAPAVSGHEIVPGLEITDDEIQAAGILMLFSKRRNHRRPLSAYNEQAPNNSTLCVILSNENQSTEQPGTSSHWLQTCNSPRQRLHGLRNLSIPPFASPHDRFSTENEFNFHLIVSCRMLTRSITTAPMLMEQQQAMHIAEQLINHAHIKKMPHEQDIFCPDCNQLPALPVTGQCGHTRCLECIKNSESCPCGMPAPEDLHVNICVQYLIGKMLANKQPSRIAVRASERPPCPEHPQRQLICALLGQFVQEDFQALPRRGTVAQRFSCGLRVSLTISPDSFTAPDVPARLPMTPQARVKHACGLIRLHRYHEAAAHLARAATYPDSDAAKNLLVQTIAILLEDNEPSTLMDDLFRAIGNQSADTWLTAADLECVLCRDTYMLPVTTPCGHTYCRMCIELSMDYRKTCPLCMRALDNFNLALTRKTTFVHTALASLNMLHMPPASDPNLVPVFVCITAFPSIPCPLLISDPHYRLTIRRILETGSRRFGMVARYEDHTESDYGTMLEVRDCLEYEDGRIILSTIGLFRFRIVERVIDSCLARVEMLTDMIPSDPLHIKVLRVFATQVALKASVWIKNLKRNVKFKIERAFGKFPAFVNEEWWRTPDGPEWLWWLVASLPLAPEIKGMMISNGSLIKRMRAVHRTLQIIVDEAQLCDPGPPPGAIMQ